MKSMTHRFGLVIVAIFISVCAPAQDPFDVHASQMELLQLKPVQRDIGITEIQRSKMNKHADWFNAETKKLQDKYGSREDQGGEEAFNALSALHGQLKTRILSELTSNQIRRLREISLQDAGPVALLDEQVATRVGLSAANLQKLRDEFEKSGKAAAELEEKTLAPIYDKYREKAMAGDTAAQTALEREINAARQRIAPEMNRLQGAFLQLLDTTLTDQNKEAYTMLQGTPFLG
ncbi:MAG: hypothetical protein KF812_06650 [Fimbriimonadaceae bacterium]|nr:hypothetical protein [Fimbriimonadaceae bacterium]